MNESSHVHTPTSDDKGQFYLPQRRPLYLAIQKWRWRRMKARVCEKQNPHQQKTVECSYRELYLLIVALGMVLVLEISTILAVV